MKKQFFSLLVFSALLGLFFTSSCKKENGDSKNDLTTDIVGKYTSGSGSSYIEIIVNKVDNQTVSIYTYDDYNGGVTHTATKMNSKTAFTLNKATYTDTDFGYRNEYEGSGTYSAGNIVINRNEKVFATSTGDLISEDNRTYTGSK